MNHNDMDFLNRVRNYVRARGENTGNWSSLEGDQYRYGICGNVRVAVSLLTDEMEVEKIDNMNPVVYVDENGEVYRFHGEFEEIRADLLVMVSR